MFPFLIFLTFPFLCVCVFITHFSSDENLIFFFLFLSSFLLRLSLLCRCFTIQSLLLRCFSLPPPFLSLTSLCFARLSSGFISLPVKFLRLLLLSPLLSSFQRTFFHVTKSTTQFISLSLQPLYEVDDLRDAFRTLGL